MPGYGVRVILTAPTAPEPDRSSSPNGKLPIPFLRRRQPCIQRFDEAAEVRQPALQFLRLDLPQKVE